MNYIVFDLEWNQAAYKVDEEDELPFEIIEIGAVKMNKNAEIVDEFSALIRPQVYPFLVRRTREITGLSDDDLDRDGIYFEDAIASFLSWCGHDYVFCIWGPGDLTQLEKNMAYYDIRIPWRYPLRYLDVQKLFALQEKEGKARRTLESAVDFYGIEHDRPFHRATDDAYYTARVLERIDRSQYESYFSVDYYKLPRNRFTETTFYFDTYSKYVSRKFSLKEELVHDRKLREIYCYKCKKKLKREIPWFSDGGRNYYCTGRCQEHGLMRCRIRVKTTEDHSGLFGVRTIKDCAPEEEATIVSKREHMKKRRREHKKQEAKENDAT